MIRSESITQLAQAMTIAQGQMKPAEMNKINPFLKNKYADLGAIIAAAREPLAANGLAFTQILLGGDGGEMSIETMLIHKSGEFIGSDVIVPIPAAEKGRSAAQEAGAVITYYKRYALAALLGVYADEDNDGQESGSKKAKTEHAAPPDNGHKPEPVAVTIPADLPQPSSEIDLETAKKVTTSEGEEYGTMDNAKLIYILSGIKKALVKNGLTDERKNELKYKQDAALTILHDRASQPA